MTVFTPKAFDHLAPDSTRSVAPGVSETKEKKHPEGVRASVAREVLRPLQGRSKFADAIPGCARKASRPWAKGFNAVGVK